MSEAIQALIVPEWGRIEFADLPRPEPLPDEALVLVDACGICSSTDWKLIRGQMPWAGEAPLVLGHESVGTVVEVGRDVSKFKVGDRVTRVVYPAIDGRVGSAFGGFARYGVVGEPRADADRTRINAYNRARQCIVPATLPVTQAVLAISLSETASVLRLLPSLAGRSIVVAGAGYAGLGFTLWCKLAGATVCTLGRRDASLARAVACGADTAINTTEDGWEARVLESLGGPADGAIEAIGNTAFAQRLSGLVTDDGFRLAYGAPADGEAFDPSWTVTDVNEQDAMGWVCDLLQRRWVPEPLRVPDVAPMDDAMNAFDRIQKREALKWVIRMS